MCVCVCVCVVCVCVCVWLYIGACKDVTGSSSAVVRGVCPLHLPPSSISEEPANGSEDGAGQTATTPLEETEDGA